MKPAKFKSWEAWSEKQLALFKIPKTTEETTDAAILIIEELRLRGHGSDGDPVRQVLSPPEVYLVIADRLAAAAIRASTRPDEVKPDELSVLAHALLLAHGAMSAEERRERGLP